MTEAIIIESTEGDELFLSKYLKAVTVQQKTVTPEGPYLLAESSGGSQYRLRAVDDDDSRLLMEKPDGDGWEAFIRLEASLEGPI